jgi:hypothetical protein
MLNGVPGSVFKCKRWVRQGDPLSPLLFLLTVDTLQTLVNHALLSGHIQRPLSLHCSSDYPIVPYADDTLVIMPADISQLLHLKELLHTFGNATGLKVNYEKSNLIPINIPDDCVSQYTSALNCQLGNLPFLYLGLPLSNTKPRKEYFMPLIMCIQRRLPSCAMYLNYGSKLRLVNSVLSSLPIFAMSTLKIYQWVLDECDKYRRHCLWRSKDLDSKTPPLASWDLVCRTKNQGGLGVLKLSV